MILLRFDRNPLICRSRVALLRELNPGVPVFGIFGGGAGFKRAAFRLGSRWFLGLEGCYWSRQGSSWNWKNGDLVLRAWYREVGYRLDFDVVHEIEWDLLLLDSLDRLYASVPPEAVGLTAVTPVSAIEHDWSWLRDPVERRQWGELLAHASAEWGYENVPLACWGPGVCLPRSFLAQYAETDPPELCHDELRLPLFAQIFGYPIVDTGFRPRWHDPDEDQFFNLSSRPVERSTILAELEKADGRRAFHPVHFASRGLRPGRRRV